MRNCQSPWLILMFSLAFAISPLRAQEGYGSNYSFGMFKRAINDDSTSPLFVLVRVKDNPAADAREICVPAPFLLGAIHIEKALPYSKNGEKEAVRIALSNWDKPFVFLRREARENIVTRYSSEDVNHIRKTIDSIPRSEVKVRLLDICAREHNRNHRYACRSAAAHVLLERGILVGIADQTGQLFCP